MRHVRFVLAGLLGASFLTLPVAAGASTRASATPSLSSCATTVAAKAYQSGTLTVGTDSPVYEPWFINNKPSNKKGYEAALVYALAKKLGVSATNVKWVTEPFDASYTPGAKKFDFDVNEISYTADRAKAVTFSQSYYDVHQSIVTLKGNRIVTHHSAADLKTYQYGDQIGTTGLAYINNYIKPAKPARVYNTLDQALAALQSHQIDAIVVDTPTGQYMASAQIKHNKGVQVGQFPSVGEHYGLLFQKDSALVGCVNAALSALKTDGTLRTLSNKWLGIYNAVPTLKP